MVTLILIRTFLVDVSGLLFVTLSLLSTEHVYPCGTLCKMYRMVLNISKSTCACYMQTEDMWTWRCIMAFDYLYNIFSEAS